MLELHDQDTQVAVIDAELACPLGTSLSQVLAALQRGESGLAYEELHGYPTALGRIRADIGNRTVSGVELDRGANLALHCIDQLRPLPTLPASRGGVFWGVGLAGAHWLESSYEMYCAERGAAKTSPWTVPMIMPNVTASLLAQRLGMTGGAWTFASACASSGMAMGQGVHAIRSGRLDWALVGGSDAMLVPGMLHAWARMRVLARTSPDAAHAACKPFDQSRNGLCLSEGAACLVLVNASLARAMGLEPRALIQGYGHSCDAHDLTAPSPAGQTQAMQMALLDANLEASDVSYVCAHATGTRQGDEVELQAIRSLFGGRVPACPVASLKSAIGHTMGASGAIAAALTVAMLETDWAAPTLHLNHKDPMCLDWNLPARTGMTPAHLKTVMVNAFGFGGSNASLIISTPTA